MRMTKKAWKASGKRGARLPRLMAHDELPPWMIIDPAEIHKRELDVEYGRGRRQRSDVNYDDGLTERQFMRMMEKGISTTEARLLKTGKRKRGKDEEEEEEEEDGGNESEPLVSRRKKNKKDAEEESVEDEQREDDDGEKESKKKGKKRRKLNEEGENDQSNGHNNNNTPKKKRGRKRKKPESEEEQEEEGEENGQRNEDADNKEEEDKDENESKDENGKKAKRKKSKKEPEKTKKDGEDKKKRGRKPKGKSFKDRFKAIWDSVRECTDAHGRVLSALFMDLPSAEDYPDYYEVIDNPVSLSVIKKNKYATKEEFKQAFGLMFDNAREYNEAGSQVFEDSKVLQKAFEEAFNAHFSEEHEATVNQPVVVIEEIPKKEEAKEEEAKEGDKKEGGNKEVEEKDSGDETENEGFL